jgi:hypothetical protein
VQLKTESATRGALCEMGQTIGGTTDTGDGECHTGATTQDGEEGGMVGGSRRRETWWEAHGGGKCGGEKDKVFFIGE